MPESFAEVLARAQALVRDEMQAVDRCIVESLASDVEMIPTIGRYIIEAGGKRMRPLLLLLAARAAGGADPKRAVPLAVAIEFIHTASLLHDDVVDMAEMRRGAPSANGVWGNEASVLVGDFLFSRAFELLVADGDAKVLARMARATNLLAEGEVMELAHAFDAEMDEARAMEVIRRKTAVLFEAAGALGALAAGRAELADRLAEYGLWLGVAFQLVDDALDYAASADALGKPAAHDLGEGRITMPLILAMQQDAELGERVRAIAARGGYADEDERAWVCARVQSAEGVKRTLDRAREAARRAVEALPEIPAEAGALLVALAERSVERRF